MAGPLQEVLLPRRVAVTLAVAQGLGPWRRFATLTLGRPVAEIDSDVDFDAVRRPPPQLAADGPMARFRAPAYARGQRRRDRVRRGAGTPGAHPPFG